MGKIEYLFYCAVLNGIVFLGELLIFYLAGKYNAVAASSIVVLWWGTALLISIWFIELVMLVMWVIKCFREKPQASDNKNGSNGGEKTRTQTAEVKAIAVAKAQG